MDWFFSESQAPAPTELKGRGGGRGSGRGGGRGGRGRAGGSTAVPSKMQPASEATRADENPYGMYGRKEPHFASPRFSSQRSTRSMRERPMSASWEAMPMQKHRELSPEPSLSQDSTIREPTVDTNTGRPRYASPRFASQRSQRAIKEQAVWYENAMEAMNQEKQAKTPKKALTTRTARAKSVSRLEGAPRPEWAKEEAPQETHQGSVVEWATQHPVTQKKPKRAASARRVSNERLHMPLRLDAAHPWKPAAEGDSVPDQLFDRSKYDAMVQSKMDDALRKVEAMMVNEKE